tara:strand:- start:6128 stop:6712 length:585 start_codon:yes stop_codon:yes gene_type:complete
MSNGRIARRVYKSKAEERTDPARATGSVVHVPMPWVSYADEDDEDEDEDDDSGQHPGFWYVEDERNGLHYWFRNRVEHNPHHGPGSQSRTYVVGRDDPEKLKPYMDVMGVDDNSTDLTRVGPILHHGAKVTFVPKARDELQLVGGDIAFHIQEDGRLTCCVRPSALSNEYAGVACDVALLPKSKRQGRSFAPVL